MRKRFHGLKKIKLRQSWNKYNLYNLSRCSHPVTSQQTYFQQKWTAKAISRAYHGETVREKHWQNMFRPHFNAVVPLKYDELARDDGAKYAMGRGSGLEEPPEKKRSPPSRTPYMNMIYAPVERRLDTAIFRALFASSTRQARQFVIHGYVKVNGKTMIYPGYQLNPGDMFQVEPDRVLYATGARKDAAERRATRKIRARSSKSSEDIDSETSEIESEAPASKDSKVSKTSEATSPPDPKQVLSSLLKQAKEFLSNPPNGIPAKRKQDLRAFTRLLKRNLSQRTTLTDSLEAQFLELTAQLNNSSSSQGGDIKTNTPKPNDPENQTDAQQGALFADLSAADRDMLRKAMVEAQENPIDPTRPYATPWRPRPFVAPFIFVPRYLEVHHRICSAVYLRHPVARPGLGEVPTPFSSETNGLAFLWYLRRR